MSKIELILHPVRFRIIAMLAGRTLTAQQLGEMLPDIAQTTLYRHINTLADAQIIEIAAEKQVRGTVERSYALAQGAARLSPDEIGGISREDHLSYFMIFLSSLMHDYRDYAEGDAFDSRRVLMSKTPLYISDAQFMAVMNQMNALLAPYLTRQSDDDQRYLFTGIVIPNSDDPSQD